MCTPAPGIVVDFLHPNIAWLFLACVVAVSLGQLMLLRTGGPNQKPALHAQAAWRLGLVATACMLLGAGYLAFVGGPSDGVYRAWLAHAEGALPAACINAANRAATVMQGALFFVCAGLPWVLGVALFAVARRVRRGLRLPWFIL